MNRYLIYMRVGRKEQLTESEVALEKYEAVLQDYSVRVLGARVPEGNIYCDLASGATFKGREGIKNVLNRVESGEVEGVLTYDVDHICRGAQRDTDLILETFRNAGTRIITPFYMLDPQCEMDMLALRSRWSHQESQRNSMRRALEALREKKK